MNHAVPLSTLPPDVQAIIAERQAKTRAVPNRSAPPKKAKMPKLTTEHTEQMLLFAWADAATGRYPELELLHAIPNFAIVEPKWGAYMKREGKRAGVPDVHLPVPRGAEHVRASAANRRTAIVGASQAPASGRRPLARRCRSGAMSPKPHSPLARTMLALLYRERDHRLSELALRRQLTGSGAAVGSTVMSLLSRGLVMRIDEPGHPLALQLTDAGRVEAAMCTTADAHALPTGVP